MTACKAAVQGSLLWNLDAINRSFGVYTFIQPAYFIISGFIGSPNMKYYYVFLFFVCIVSVLGNVAVMAVICLDHNLRTPKYVAVFNLAFVDLLGSCALIPKVLDIFLFNHYYVPYNDCLTFLFFCYTCLSMQALNLVALCYDRLMIMFSMITFFGVFAITCVLLAIGLLTRLSFCKSVVITAISVTMVKSTSWHATHVISHLLPSLFLWLPLIIICSSCIGYTLAQVVAAQERAKALRTCTAHLLLVLIYFCPILITFTMGSGIHPNARFVNLSLIFVIPPLLNPVIYVLHTQEIRLSIKTILKEENVIYSN
uniref:G-protein coupled receptors family 1 profile domain-containing protein n=1 Tax=Poecilia reticulata TaxID=8081 RepID=A0A3P9P041_POERE